uniref:Uncharacterized protein n=1 Tax=Macaca nemestrina TaxID=9545 RepID=A0A2K6B4U0_MACNE
MDSTKQFLQQESFDLFQLKAGNIFLSQLRLHNFLKDHKGKKHGGPPIFTPKIYFVVSRLTVYQRDTGRIAKSSQPAFCSLQGPFT